MIVFVAYDGFQLIDVTGPAAVFAEAAEVDQRAQYQIMLASVTGGPVRSSANIEVATCRLDAITADRNSTLMVPGAHEIPVRSAIADGALIGWLSQNAPSIGRICSVCTGAFILAAAGVLSNSRVTTHWMAADQLEKMFPHLIVDRHALYVRDGALWTSAGVSTGIDMALALLEEDYNQMLATEVARRLVLQSRRPGHQSQFSTLLNAQGGGYAKLVEWIASHLTDDLSLDALAARCAQSVRTFHRKFSREVGMTPAALVEALRLDHARSLLEAGEDVKRASAASGFRSLDHLRRCFVRQIGLTPSQYRFLHKTR